MGFPVVQPPHAALEIEWNLNSQPIKKYLPPDSAAHSGSSSSPVNHTCDPCSGHSATSVKNSTTHTQSAHRIVVDLSNVLKRWFILTAAPSEASDAFLDSAVRAIE